MPLGFDIEVRKTSRFPTYNASRVHENVSTNSGTSLATTQCDENVKKRQKILAIHEKTLCLVPRIVTGGVGYLSHTGAALPPAGTPILMGGVHTATFTESSEECNPRT